MISYLNLKAAARSILLISLAVLIFGCKKSKKETSVTPAPALTTGMGGTRNWHGHHYYEAGGVHFPVPVYESWFYPDTSFAVTIVSDSSIEVFGSVFNYERSDSVQQIHYFGGAYFYYTYGAEKGVAYFYAKDSIVFCEGDRHGTEDSWTLSNLYYTY